MNKRRGIRIARDERLEERFTVPTLAVEDMVDQSAQESDVTSGPDGGVDVAVRGRSREPRIHMNQRRTVQPGLERPPERDRMTLGHVRAHDDDAIRMLHVPRIHRRCAAPQPCPQTGDAGAVSYPRLVFDRNDPEAATELLADVVELVVEGGAA